MLIRGILLVAVIAVAFVTGIYSTTPDGQKAFRDLRAMVMPPEESAPDTDMASTENAESDGPATEDDIAAQRAALAAATDGQGFGPQSPRDLATAEGNNKRLFAQAPDYTGMNLCNIHFHEGAEHRGGQFTTYAGPGNGKGYGTGFLFDGTLTEAELTPVAEPVGVHENGSLEPGDTIEIHFVHSTADVVPGPTLGSCISEAIGNPQLRVETVVAVLVNDAAAADMTELAALGEINGYQQALNIPQNLGTPIAYRGSTTGPSFNEKASPFQVSWSVRPDVLKLDITSVAAWFADNPFDEKYAHGVRNLVTNPSLISSLDP